MSKLGFYRVTHFNAVSFAEWRETLIESIIIQSTQTPPTYTDSAPAPAASAGRG